MLHSIVSINGTIHFNQSRNGGKVHHNSSNLLQPNRSESENIEKVRWAWLPEMIRMTSKIYLKHTQLGSCSKRTRVVLCYSADLYVSIWFCLYRVSTGLKSHDSYTSQNVHLGFLGIWSNIGFCKQILLSALFFTFWIFLLILLYKIIRYLP